MVNYERISMTILHGERYAHPTSAYMNYDCADATGPGVVGQLRYLRRHFVLFWSKHGTGLTGLSNFHDDSFRDFLPFRSSFRISHIHIHSQPFPLPFHTIISLARQRSFNKESCTEALRRRQEGAAGHHHFQIVRERA